MRNRFCQRTGIESTLARADNLSQQADEGLFKKQLRQVIAGTRAYLHAVIIATEVYAVPIAVLILARPTFLRSGLTALIEGMTVWDIRHLFSSVVTFIWQDTVGFPESAWKQGGRGDWKVFSISGG